VKTRPQYKHARSSGCRRLHRRGQITTIGVTTFRGSNRLTTTIGAW
jgi:hypothetical protein